MAFRTKDIPRIESIPEGNRNYFKQVPHCDTCVYDEHPYCNHPDNGLKSFVKKEMIDCYKAKKRGKPKSVADMRRK